MNKRLSLLAGICSAATAFFASAPVGATVSLYAQTANANNGAIVFLGSDNGAGGLTYSGNYGLFYNSISAVGGPAISSPILLSQAISVTGSSAGLLSLFVVQSDVSGSPLNLLSTMTVNSFVGAVTSVTGSTYASAENPFTPSDSGGFEFKASLLASHTFTGIGTFGRASSVLGFTGPYYEVARYDLLFGTGGGSTNQSINIQKGLAASVPEPGTWAMMLIGFGIVGGTARYRRRTAATANS